MLVAGNNVTGVMKEFGEIMMKMYSKTLDYRKNDFSLNFLGSVRLDTLLNILRYSSNNDTYY